MRQRRASEYLLFRLQCSTHRRHRNEVLITPVGKLKEQMILLKLRGQRRIAKLAIGSWVVLVERRCLLVAIQRLDTI
jgi:hypothetical protein